MKNFHVLYERGDYRWTVLHRDPEKPEDVIDTNEYIISCGGKHLLLDPGSISTFPSILSALVQVIDPADIESIFLSHVDPDVGSSIGFWYELNPSLKCYLPWIWESFCQHFGGGEDTYSALPDKGGEIQIGEHKLEVIPAHHMHSAGNLHLYDRESKILFTGDTGAAFLPENNRYLFVEDFYAHVSTVEGFHKRWFGSNEHKNNWCERVSEMDIEILAPQHGAIYCGDNVKRFIDWLHQLNVGVASNRGSLKT